MGIHHRVTKFKSLQIALKELESFVRNGWHLQNGKPFAKFGDMRSREAWANWLTCAAVNSIAGPERLTFTSDPVGGDGIIVDQLTDETWPTEHVMVSRFDAGPPIEDLVLERIELKRTKGGEAYAKGKTLIVFLDVAGEPWNPTITARRLPAPLLFDAVWVVGLERAADTYTYNVTRLDTRRGAVPAWRVTIAQDFCSWAVEPIQ